MIERSTAIIVTIPVQVLINMAMNVLNNRKAIGDKSEFTKKALIKRGYVELIKQIESIKDDPEMYWLHSMGNKPVNEDNILYCYINILSAIRYRAKVIGFESAAKGKLKTQKFDDGRKWSGKHWLMLHEFQKIRTIKMGGFQGFRYWRDDY